VGSFSPDEKQAGMPMGSFIVPVIQKESSQTPSDHLSIAERMLLIYKRSQAEGEERVSEAKQSYQQNAILDAAKGRSWPGLIVGMNGNPPNFQLADIIYQEREIAYL